MELPNKPSFTGVCMCVCVRCLLCTLSFRTTKEQPSHLKCVQRSHVSGGRRLSFKPARCWFASPLDFQFLWWPQRCLTPQVRRTWKGRATKGAGQFMRTCVRVRTRALASTSSSSLASATAKQESRDFKTIRLPPQILHSIETSLCLPSVLGKPVLWR